MQLVAQPVAAETSDNSRSKRRPVASSVARRAQPTPSISEAPLSVPSSNQGLTRLLRTPFSGLSPRPLDQGGFFGRMRHFNDRPTLTCVMSKNPASGPSAVRYRAWSPPSASLKAWCGHMSYVNPICTRASAREGCSTFPERLVEALLATCAVLVVGKSSYSQSAISSPAIQRCLCSGLGRR